MLTPTLHKPIPMNTRVRVVKDFWGSGIQENQFVGTVVGIASMHVIFIYIVLLDTPALDPDFGEIRAIPIGGSGLESEDGLTNWRTDR